VTRGKCNSAKDATGKRRRANGQAAGARVDAHRQGFLEGADSCESFVQEKPPKKSKANDEESS